MNRRAFFATLAAGLAAASDPECLLWVPGKKLISIPKPQAAWRGIDWGSREAVTLVEIWRRDQGIVRKYIDGLPISVEAFSAWPFSSMGYQPPWFKISREITPRELVALKGIPAHGD